MYIYIFNEFISTTSTFIWWILPTKDSQSISLDFRYTCGFAPIKMAMKSRAKLWLTGGFRVYPLREKHTYHTGGGIQTQITMLVAVQCCVYIYIHIYIHIYIDIPSYPTILHDMLHDIPMIFHAKNSKSKTLEAPDVSRRGFWSRFRSTKMALWSKV